MDQMPRVTIARALAMHPTGLLFDEPTSVLDPEIAGEVLSAMSKIFQDHPVPVLTVRDFTWES